MRRSNLLVLLGVAFFLVGGVIVWLITADDDDGGSGNDAQAVVVVGTDEISAGALADELIEAQRLKEIEVPVSEVLPGAVQSLSQLAGATFTQGFAANQQITQTGLLLQSRTFEVPEGYEAIAVQLDFVAAGAGYVNPGDRINLYASLSVGSAKLVLTNVEVLDVDLTVPPRRGTSTTDPNAAAGARPSASSVTYLLSVKTNDAEKLVYLTEREGLYAALPAADSPPAGPTEGRNSGNILSEEANVAASK